MNNRPSWDETFFEVAETYGKRATCVKFKVGAVFVRNRRILAAGYNGPPKNEPHCIDVGCAKDAGQDWCNGAHAEINAIGNAASEGVNLVGATLYCTYSPCILCAKQLVNLEISRLVYRHKYKKSNNEGDAAIDLLERSGVKVEIKK